MMSQRALVLLVLTACATPTARPPLASVAYQPSPLPVPAIARAGDPSDEQLAAHRLAATTCEVHDQTARDRTEAAIAAMHTEMHERHARWKTHARAKCSPWPDTIGASFARGGLGVTACCALEIPPPAPRHVSVPVLGVDAAEPVKVDAGRAYSLAGGALRVLEGRTVVSVTPLGPATPRGLIVSGHHVLVQSSTPHDTELQIFDVTNPRAPRRIHQVRAEGAALAVRRVGSRAIVVVNRPEPQPVATLLDPVGWPDCGNSAADVAEAERDFARVRADNERALRAGTMLAPTLTFDGAATPHCTVLAAPDTKVQASTTILSLDLEAAEIQVRSLTLRLQPDALHVSARAVYLATTHEQRTEIHQLHLGAEGPIYAGVGLVPGHVVDAAALDEWEGTLRVATTTETYPDEERHENIVSTLIESPRGNLIRVGATPSIAPTDRIRSVHYDDDRAYVQTTTPTHPVYALDLDNPLQPTIRGVLDIRGISTFMHRVDPEHLLTVTFGALGARTYDGLSVQMFDTRDTRLLQRWSIGARGLVAPVASAVSYAPEQGLLALPVTTCGSVSAQPDFSGLVAFSLSKGSFRELDRIAHRPIRCQDWWNGDTSNDPRAARLGARLISATADQVLDSPLHE